MADHYHQCSVLLPRPAGDEAEIDKRLQEWRDTIQAESGNMLLDEGDDAYELWARSFDANVVQGPRKRVMVYADGDSGSTEAVLALVQRYLRDFGMTAVGIPVSFAHWCSKPRPGEAGGGEVVVTATEMLCADVRREAAEAGVELVEAF
jgi:hypothetical protein